MARKKKHKPDTDSPRQQAQAVVIRSTGSSIRVRLEDGRQYDCVVRGKFRIKGLKTTNPVAVGDRVEVLLPGEAGELGVIHRILPRTNYILRRAVAAAHKVHILCANIDQAILLYTLDQPPTSTGFADRFLVTAEAYHIPAIVLINKIDLLTQAEQKARLEEVTALYRGIGYPVHHLCALDTSHRELLIELLQHKVSFLGGHSGSGKSTLINLIDPSLHIKTATVSDYSHKGRHTTTFAQMHPLAIGGYVIDSPGIREMGIVAFQRHDLSHYFPEMRQRLSQCRFNDCMHINEPDCAVKAALQSGQIAPSRYQSYLRMLEEVE